MRTLAALVLVGALLTLGGRAEADTTVYLGPDVLTDPEALAIDGHGNMFIADGTRILKVDTSTNPPSAPVVVDLSQAFGMPVFPDSLAVAPNGDIYFAESELSTLSHRAPSLGPSFVWRYDTMGQVTGVNTVWTDDFGVTFFGLGLVGPPPPRGLACNPNGDLFIADNYSGLVYRVDPSNDSVGEVVVGNENSIYWPWSWRIDPLAIDAAGNLFAGSPVGVQNFYDVTIDPASSTAGELLWVFGAIGTDRTWRLPPRDDAGAIVLDAQDNAFVADLDGVWRIPSDGGATTQVLTRFLTPGPGMNGAHAAGLAIDFDGNLFVADAGNRQVYRITGVAVPRNTPTHAGTGVTVPVATILPNAAPMSVDIEFPSVGDGVTSVTLQPSYQYSDLYVQGATAVVYYDVKTTASYTASATNPITLAFDVSGDPAFTGAAQIDVYHWELAPSSPFGLIYQWIKHTASYDPVSHKVTASVASLSPFAIVIQSDTTPPTLSAHADVTARATDVTGAVVAFDAPTATDLIDGVDAVSCSPASGSLFPVGVTTVTCTASDKAGNKATSSFAVTVKLDPAFLIDTVGKSLARLVPSGDKKTDKSILEVIAALEASRKSGLWLDDTHLAKDGRRVFDDLADAVKKLLSIAKPPSGVTQAVRDLVEVSRVLAQSALDGASGLDSTRTERATTTIAEAGTDVTQGQFAEAVSDYGQGWQLVTAH